MSSYEDKRRQQMAGYAYSAMSSQVTTADKRFVSKRDQEAGGEIESLSGKISIKDMGSRARVAAADQPKPAASLKDREQVKIRARMSHMDVLAATNDLEGLKYRPRTPDTRQVFELILSSVHAIVGDQPQDVVRSAADYVLECLKEEDASKKDLDRKRGIEDGIGARLTEATFNELVALGKKITDYADGDDDAAADPDGKEGEIDEDVGVAVVFEEEEEDEEMQADGDEEGGVAGFIASSDDEEDEQDAEGAQPEAMDDGEAAIRIGGSSSKKQDAGKLTARDIDGFWLQRLIATVYSDPQTATSKTADALELLGSEANARDAENGLMELFDFDHFEIVQRLVANRDRIVWCTRLARADEAERMDIEVAMRERGVGWILKELVATTGAAGKAADMQVDQPEDVPRRLTLAPGSLVKPRQTVDLDSMAFAQGARLMSNKKCKLPDGSFKRTKKSYEEIHIPVPPKVQATDRLVPVTALPEWAREPFKSHPTLNRIQSRLFPAAFHADPDKPDEPLLLCAPTGAGKTNVAMLCMLNEINKHRDPETGAIDFNAFKIIYIAPMKALVAEQVGNFSKRLEYLGIEVQELTGDRSLTKEQIAATQIIVTTPEKWDVITRKSTDTSYTNLVRLMIIDEIHLLHDERGPVLEALVARTIRRMEQTQDYVRLVGLSATLPNFADVARFLRVSPERGLFHFDASFRPCPLKQQFIGVTEKRALTRHQVMNEVCYDKLLEQVQSAEGGQCLVFVHSRKETASTARFLRDKALEAETITQFVRPDSVAREVLQTEAEKTRDPQLKDLLPFGFAIHNAGMTREDRTTVEDLFAEGHIRCLVSTATLAWGVNLPAHAVIIKGTQIYNPEKGRWVELSPQDVLQMIGRAGRPQFDTFGESVIITNHSELQYYLSMLNQQLPIESQLVKKLPDNLNAEIVLGSIRNRDEAVAWLGYTYWFQRALQSPVLYGISADYKDDDSLLIQKRADIVHTAAVHLEKAGLVKYDRSSGVLTSTELGRIASYYFIGFESMADYNKHLKPTIGFIELFRIFSISAEFKFVPVREDEKQELAKLMDRVPIPVKESVDDPSAKINVLLQAYISQLKLDGFALVSDMVYVTQSAGRILRAIFEICLKRGWAALTYKTLELCKMVEKRMWSTMTPLRQFKGIPLDIVRRAERKEYPWYRYFFLEPPELGELLGLPKAGRLVHKLVHEFPLLLLSAHVQPITRSLLRIELTITPDFQWDERVHGSTERFWIVVEDVDGEMILFADEFQLRQRFASQDHYFTFTVPLLEPTPPNYFIAVVSDRWMHSVTRLPISFQHLILPAKFPAPTALLELQPLPVSALHNKEYESLYDKEGGVKSFNKIQTQTFQALYTTNDSVLVCAPTGSGKTILAEFALLRLWAQKSPGRAVCLEPYQEVVDARVKEWTAKFPDRTIVSLTGETTNDVRLLNKSEVVVCTPTQWDLISRGWKRRKAVQEIALMIADEIHLIGGNNGPVYEVVLSRTRYIAEQVEFPTRFVSLGVSLANAKDVADWLGVSAQNTFNFSPGARPLPLEVHLQSFNIPHFPSLMVQMAKPTYLAITESSDGRPVLVFVPTRRYCRQAAQDLLQYCLADQDPLRFLNIEQADLEPHLERIQDASLRETLTNGIGYYHEGLSAQDRLIVERLYQLGAIQVVVASKDTAWSIPLTAYMVILMGTQTFEGKEHRYVDYPFPDILQMMGRACRPLEDASSKCVLMVPQVRKPFFLKFLAEGLPIESHVHLNLADFLLSEIASGTIENKQECVDWFTWLWCYRRLSQNPNYYNLQGTSHRHISDHLSQLVEDTLDVLKSAHCINIEDEMDLSVLNLGLIASFYQVSSITLDTFSMSLNEKTKITGLLEIISSAVEFEDVPIRHHEDQALSKLYERLPVKLSNVDYQSPNFKTCLLLQAHFSRLPLPPDLQTDQQLILGRVIKLLSAAVDVMSSSGYANAMKAMDMTQMVVQAMWDIDSPLRQIPGFTREIIDRCKSAGIDSVWDIPELEDDQRDQILQMSAKEMAHVARFCNAYPSVEVSHEVLDAGNLKAGAPIRLQVDIEREEDEEDSAKHEQQGGYAVVAPFYPGKKIENWWLVVIQKGKNDQLLSIKKVPLLKQHRAVLEWTSSKGTHELLLSVICDSYVGNDKEIGFSIEVAEGEESDDEESSSGADDSDVEMADA